MVEYSSYITLGEFEHKESTSNFFGSVGRNFEEMISKLREKETDKKAKSFEVLKISSKQYVQYQVFIGDV